MMPQVTEEGQNKDRLMYCLVQPNTAVRGRESGSYFLVRSTKLFPVIGGPIIDSTPQETFFFETKKFHWQS